MAGTDWMNARLTDELIAQTRAKVDQDAAHQRSLNAVTKNGINLIAEVHENISMPISMSIKLDTWEVTNQERAGLCWLYATLNVLRPVIAKKLNVASFELAEDYLVFWDKFERANFFLNQMIHYADEPLDGMLMQNLMQGVMQDGGDWAPAVSLIKRYGVMPYEAMPKTFASNDTARVDTELQRLLRRSALEIRDLVAGKASDEALQAKKAEVLEGAYRIISISFGTPPTEFDWQWRDKDDTFHRDGVLTPQEFFTKYVDLDLDSFVNLVDDPRSSFKKNALYTMPDFGNVAGDKSGVLFNAEMADIKRAVIQTLESGQGVWFACNVVEQVDEQAGILHAQLYDYSGVYGVDLSTTKEQRVLMGEGGADHAMHIVGVDLVDGVPRRWRIENTWGAEVGGKPLGDKGYFTMDDTWFTEYVYAVAVPKSVLSPEMAAVLDTEPIVVPVWDPMYS